LQIKAVETLMLQAELQEPLTIAGVSPFTVRQSNLVRIKTDEGIDGVGEIIVRAAPEATEAIVRTILKPILIGSDPFDVELLWQRMFSAMSTRGHSKGFMIEAISGVDIALWDIIGKATKLPLYRLLGGRQAKQLRAYATALTFKDKKELVKDAERFLEMDFEAMKLKIGRGPRVDVENMKTVRESVGDEVLVMTDANSGYDATTAIKVGRQIERCGAYWLEEPVPPHDIDGYVSVRKALDMPVAGGESEFTRFGFRDLISRGAVDIVQPDVTRAGGFSEVKKILALAEAYNLPYAPHNFGSAVCLAASIQMAASAPNFLVLEYDATPNPLREDLPATPLPEVRNGSVEAPPAPGLGLEIDEDALARYTIKRGQ